MDDQKKMILHEFNEYKGDETQRDDNTMIGLRVWKCVAYDNLAYRQEKCHI